MNIFLSSRFTADERAIARGLEDVLLSLDCRGLPLTAEPFAPGESVGLITRALVGNTPPGRSLSADVQWRIRVCDALVAIEGGTEPDLHRIKKVTPGEPGEDKETVVFSTWVSQEVSHAFGSQKPVMLLVPHYFDQETIEGLFGDLRYVIFTEELHKE